MPITYIAIQTVTVGAGGATTIDFTSIPQTYTDLVIKLSGRSTHSSIDPVFITFNGAATSTTSYRSIFADGSTVSSFNGSGAQIQYIPGTGQTANTFNNAEIYIPNYTSSNNKSFSIDAVQETNAATAYIVPMACLWSNTAAITSITLDPATGNFAQYTTATLYGVSSTSAGAKATGGIITQSGGYYIHTFLSSGTFTPTANISAEYLVVAGGGATYYDGGTDRAWSGGGGAGGYRTNVGGTLTSFTNGTAYTITVGAGGTRGTTPTKGGNSSIAGTGLTTISATGGGQGPAGNGDTGKIGGSGSGGGASPAQAGGAGNEGNYSPVEGYAGGAGGSTYGGGGGGSAGVGTAGTTGQNAAGGAGTSNSITGTAVTYAAGGNGGNSGGAFVSGAANTGNGAGYGGNGGSGIVVIRYQA